MPVFEAAGWTAVPYDGDPQRGYILWRTGHVELYIGDGLTVGAHCSETGGIYGQPGDQTGNEISVAPNPGGWDVILRPPAEIPMLKEDDLKPISNDGGEVYRLYNPHSGDHLYTTGAVEKGKLVEAGWTYEGVAFKAPRGGTRAVYRMYNPNAGDHMWTVSYDEASALQAAGWRYECVPWFGNDKGTEVLRLYNPNEGDHFFTTEPAEKDALVKAGWIYEGVAWYV